MIGMRTTFAIVMAVAMMSTLLAFGAQKNLLTPTLTVPLAIVVILAVVVFIFYRSRKRIAYNYNVKGKAIEDEEKLLKLLNIGKIIPKESCILAKDFNGKRLVGHAYVRITSVPYLIDDLDREKKLWYVGNFVRILSTLTFPFEIDHRIMPVSTEALMGNINREIRDLQVTLSAEGPMQDPAREARLRQLRRISERLLKGERPRDVSFQAHIFVEGADEAQIAKDLDSNCKTMISALESGLSIKAERLTGYKMIEGVKEFFRATRIIRPSKSNRILSWDLAYLIPLTKPKLPPIEKLLSGVYLGRTASSAVVCRDIERYANPHVMILGKG